STSSGGSSSRLRLLDPQQVGLPSLDPFRHSCRGSRVRNPLQPYRRSSASFATPSRAVRLPSPSRTPNKLGEHTFASRIKPTTWVGKAQSARHTKVLIVWFSVCLHGVDHMGQDVTDT